MNFRKYLFVIIFFLILAGIHLFFFVKNVSLKYSITSLKLKFIEINSKTRMLGSLVAKEQNLTFIEKTAKEKLGMLYPEKMNYLVGTKEAPND